MRKFLFHISLTAAAIILCAGQAFARDGGDARMGVPFFRNYSASQYNAHNRNFDVLCDEEGRTYFANFEGLLIYDQVDWQIVHTPDISRVVSLHRDDDGSILFDAINLVGRIQAFEGDSVSVSYTQVTGLGRRAETKVDRWNDVEVYQRLKLSDNRTLLATATEGVVAIDDKGQEIWHINVENGLCSNSITKLAYDGKGTVWGATDNGVFSISVSEIYTHFTDKEGLRGQISCIAMCGPDLMVGTFQGLYRLEGQRFVKVSRINHACWQIAPGPEGTIYVATSDGVYEYAKGNVRQLSNLFALSIAPLDDGSYLVGELEHISRLHPGKEIVNLAEIPSVTQFKKDDHGMWAMTLSGEYHYLANGDKTFEKKDKGPLSRLFEYQDSKGNVWRCNGAGMGLYCDSAPEDMQTWMAPFTDLKVNAMLVQDGIAWIGDNQELLRFDLNKCRTAKRFEPLLHVRRYSFEQGNLSLSIANDKRDPIGQTLYSYRLKDENDWSRWSEQQEYLFANMGYGSYQISIRSKDAFGQISENGPYILRNPYPFYVRWYSMLLYLFVIVFGVYLLFRLRMHRMAQEQQRLEAIVDERTKELRSAQNQLLRQEREAAIGKLTKGLIDRILNPMNYINNFAHLTLGLSKELRANIEDEKEHITPDTYEDCVDVMDMMTTNLDKIEQHGISTTRTLKAMEEMLKERSLNLESTDLALLCQQCVERFIKYSAQDIDALHIQVDCERPVDPVMRDVVADQVAKSLMSMLANALYAVKKKAEKGGEYAPVIRLTVEEKNGVAIKVYDNGIGIESSILNKIFDPFFTTKPTAEAPGVGLYLSQQAMHDSGGNITVDSVKDEYTEFVINLA